MTRPPALALLALCLCAFSPFEVEERHVREGNERLLAGDAGGALDRYAAAEAERGPRPEIEFDRAHALLRQGRGAEALAAWRRVLERGPTDALASRALQNVGTVLEAGKDREGAVKALTEALRRDPKNEDARFDLEVLLRREAESAKEQAQGGQDDQARTPQGAQPGGPGKLGSAPQPKAPSAPQAAAPRPVPGKGEGAPGERPPPDAGAQREPPEARPAPLTRQAAEALLDALRSREKELPAAGLRTEGGRRADAAKDW